MKKFTKNSIKQIVKYVKIFFEGTLKVEHLGVFQFQQGMLRAPQDANEQQQSFVSKINQLIKSRQPVAQWE
ncbi:MAG: DUF1107 family protein [Psychrobium sp.]